MASLSAIAQDNTRSPSNELRYGMIQLAQQNPNAAYSQYGQDYLQADVPLASFESPVMGRQIGQSHANNPYAGATFSHSYPGLHASTGMALGVQYNEYSIGPPNQYHGDHYGYGLPYLTNGTQYGYPMTPQSIDSENGLANRSGRSSLGRSDGSSGPKNDTRRRVSKSPKPRRTKANKSSASALSLEAPLSVLTKDMTDIQVRDMETWVNRSVEERLKEVKSSKEGHIPRPMNSFMLYRSAYTERTKKYCAQHNHQVVSKMSGASWKLESDEVKNHYEHLAKIERDNHQKAHPEYKFSPSKVGAASSFRRKKDNSSTDDEDEIDEYFEHGDDSEWQPRRDRRGKSAPRQTALPTTFSPHETPFDHRFGLNSGHNRSTWEITNEGKPVPVPVGSNDMFQQYYQTSVHPSLSDPRIEDVRMRQVQAPGTLSAMPIGIPGSYQDDLFSGTDHGCSPHYESHVDPTLFQFIDQFSQEHTSASSMDHTMSIDTHEQVYGHSFSNGGPKSQLEEWMEDANSS